MSKLDRKAARERCEKATPGPWHTKPETVVGNVWIQRGQDRWSPDCEPLFRLRGDTSREEYAQREKDAEWVVAARTDLPLALDELDEKDRRIAELEAALLLLLEDAADNAVLSVGKVFQAHAILHKESK